MTLYADERDALRRATSSTSSGDYRRAIDLLETARGYFDDAARRAAGSACRRSRPRPEFRVVTRARFDRLASGMTAAQVKALVGVPFSGNVHRTEVAGKQVTSWLYGSEDELRDGALLRRLARGSTPGGGTSCGGELAATTLTSS